MIVLFLIICLIVIAGLAVLWASRLPGSVIISLGPDSAVELKLVVAILAVLLIGAAMAVIWGALTGLLKMPKRFSKSRQASKTRNANKALADGLLAAEAGDVSTARKYASRAAQHAEDDRLKLLLEARTAEISDDWSGAERAWGQLAALPGGKLAGLRGAATAASERGDIISAEARAREALELRSDADSTARSPAATGKMPSTPSPLARNAAPFPAIASAVAAPCSTPRSPAIYRTQSVRTRRSCSPTPSAPRRPSRPPPITARAS